MLNAMLARFHTVKAEVEEDIWVTKMQGGRGYEIYCRQMEIEWEIEHNERGIRPTKAGLWLISVATDIGFYLRLAHYVVTGRSPYGFEPNLGDDYDRYRF